MKRWKKGKNIVLNFAEFRFLIWWWHYIIMSSCNQMIKTVQRKTHFTSGKQPFSSRSPPSKNDKNSPTQNAFHLSKTAIFIKIALIVKWLTSPTQNAFYLGKTAIFIKIAPIEKWVKKSNAKRVLLKENNHFHQDRPHHKMIEKVQRKTHFQ